MKHALSPLGRDEMSRFGVI